ARVPQERLVVVGDGPDADLVRASAPPNVQFVGTVADDELRWLYAHTRGTVAAAFEDFGLSPLQAAAFGRPSAVLAAGGYRGAGPRRRHQLPRRGRVMSQP